MTESSISTFGPCGAKLRYVPAHRDGSAKGKERRHTRPFRPLEDGVARSSASRSLARSGTDRRIGPRPPSDPASARGPRSARDRAQGSSSSTALARSRSTLLGCGCRRSIRHTLRRRRCPTLPTPLSPPLPRCHRDAAPPSAGSSRSTCVFLPCLSLRCGAGPANFRRGTTTSSRAIRWTIERGPRGRARPADTAALRPRRRARP